MIAVYTITDCLGIHFEEEQELQNWLTQLLRLQKGPLGAGLDDGRIPRPRYEHMWQVTVKHFKPEDPLNPYVMSGPHRIVATADDIKFFPVGSDSAISFDLGTIRLIKVQDRQCILEMGRRAYSGAGVVFMLCDDKDIADTLHHVVTRFMEMRNKGGQQSSKGSSGASKGMSLRSHDTTSSLSRRSHRPRSESW